MDGCGYSELKERSWTWLFAGRGEWNFELEEFVLKERFVEVRDELVGVWEGRGEV